jgi:hypothetical protein
MVTAGFKTKPTSPDRQVSHDLHPDHLSDLARSGIMPQDLERLGVQVWSLTPADLEVPQVNRLRMGPPVRAVRLRHSIPLEQLLPGQGLLGRRLPA